MSKKLFLMLAAALAVPQAATLAQGAPYVRLSLEPSETACRDARARRGQQIEVCLYGVAYDPSGIAGITVNGRPATVGADSAGGKIFVGFAPVAQLNTPMEVTIVSRGTGGTETSVKYRVTPASSNGMGYHLVNLTPRVLGGGAAVEGQAASAAPLVPSPTPSTQVASLPAPVQPENPPAAPAAPPAENTVAAPPAEAAQPAVAAAPAAPPPAPAGDFIQIIEPREWAGTGTRGLTLAPRNAVRVVGVARHPNGIQRIEVNGVRASQSPDANGGTRFVAYVAPAPGMTEVEVVVRGLAGTPVVSRYPVSLVQPAVAEGAPANPSRTGFRGRRWAVVVGVSAYQDSAIKGLRFADADARAFYDFLRSERSGLGGFQEENIKLLLNEQATYREIRSALFTFLKSATEDDQVVIYFAGHGSPDPQRLSNLYLLTHDTELSDIAGSAFPMEDMQKAIRELYARDILVITDACHSAGVGGQVATRDLGINQINETFLQQLSASTGGLAIFTASGANQLSQEDERWGGGHGVFTHFLLEGLNGAADEDGDHIVTLVEMMEFTRARVRAETQNAQIPTISQTAYDPYWPFAIVVAPGEAPGVVAAANESPRPAPVAPVPAAPARPAAPAAASSRAANEAITRYQEAVRQFPRSAVYRVNLGRALREAGRMDESITELREAVRLEPQRAEHRRELGATLRAANKLPEAAAELLEGVRLDGRNAGVLAELAAVMSAQGNHVDAVDRLRRASRLQPDSARFHRELGRALLSASRPQEAVTELREAARLAAGDPAIRRDLAEALAAAGLPLDGINELREAVRLAGNDAATHAALAEALQAAGFAQDALQAMRDAARLEPRTARYRHALGALLASQGSGAESLVELREAARLEAGNATYRFDLGQALMRAGQAQDAAAQLQEAARIEPTRARYHNALGQAQKAAGLPQEALASFREAIRLENGNARYHADLGIFLRDLGELQQALTELQTAVQLDGSQREYREALNEVRRRMR